MKRIFFAPRKMILTLYESNPLKAEIKSDKFVEIKINKITLKDLQKSCKHWRKSMKDKMVVSLKEIQRLY